MNKIRIIFFGTPEFAKIVLEKLIPAHNLPNKAGKQADFEIVAVVTAPDKPVGRKQVLTPPLIKVLAQENNIPVLQPNKLNNEFISKLKELDPDLHVVASYGKIIPQAVLDIPKHGNINVHPSLLPKYRGASPIQSVLLNGDKETGVTIMLMDEKMDHGEIVSSIQCPVSKNEKFKELHDRLANLGADLLVKTIPDYLSGKIKPQEQDHDKATFCKMIKKSDGEIDWQQPAEKIYNQWRALYLWPGIFSDKCLGIKDENLKIKFIELSLINTKNHNLKPGVFFTLKTKGLPAVVQLDCGVARVEGVKAGQAGLFIVCGNNTALEIKKLQPEGKKIMDAQGFINGYLK